MTISRIFILPMFLFCAFALFDCVPDDEGGDSYDISLTIPDNARTIA